jgi:hypothetical protein
MSYIVLAPNADREFHVSRHLLRILVYRSTPRLPMWLNEAGSGTSNPRRDQVTPDAFLKKASPEELLTEAHAYIGIKAHIEGNRATALQHLQRVKDKGRPDYTEYGVGAWGAGSDRARKAVG